MGVKLASASLNCDAQMLGSESPVYVLSKLFLQKNY